MITLRMDAPTPPLEWRQQSDAVALLLLVATGRKWSVRSTGAEYHVELYGDGERHTGRGPALADAVVAALGSAGLVV